MKFFTPLFFLLLLASPLAAQQLSYEVLGFGSQRVLVTIQGDIPLGMTSNMSADGLSARISGVGIQFQAKDPNKALPLAVSSVQQVKRGSTTDLVINLSNAAELTVSPGVSELKLFLKAKKGVKPVDNSSGTPGATENSHLKRVKSPIRFLSSHQISGFGNATLVEPGFTIVFPDVAGVKPTSSLSSILHLMGYTWDLVWSALSQNELQLIKRDDGGNTTASDTEENKRLSTLVDELTKELVTVRQELERVNQQLEENRSNALNGAQ